MNIDGKVLIRFDTLPLQKKLVQGAIAKYILVKNLTASDCLVVVRIFPFGLEKE